MLNNGPSSTQIDPSNLMEKLKNISLDNNPISKVSHLFVKKWHNIENSVWFSMVIRTQIMYENKSLSNFHVNFRCNMLWNWNLNEKNKIKQRHRHNPWGQHILWDKNNTH